MIHDAQGAIRRGDAAGVERVGHALKRALGNLGAIGNMLRSIAFQNDGEKLVRFGLSYVARLKF